MGTAIGIIGTVLAVISLWLAWRWNRQSKQEINKIRDETVAARVVLNNRLDIGVAVKLEDPPGKWARADFKRQEGIEPGPDLLGIWVVERSGHEPVVVHDRHAMEALIRGGSRRTMMTREAEDRLGLSAELSRRGRGAAPRPPTWRS